MIKEFLEAGQIVSTHGVRGECKVLPWADGPEFLLDFKEVYLNGKAVRVQSSRVQKTCVLLKLEGVDTVEEAAKLRDTVVCIRRADAKLPEGSLFVQDLLGLTVLCDGAEVGRLTDVIPMPAGDVYEVTGEKTYLIPSVPEFVLERNPEEGYIRVKLLEGMEA